MDFEHRIFILTVSVFDLLFAEQAKRYPTSRKHFVDRPRAGAVFLPCVPKPLIKRKSVHTHTVAFMSISPNTPETVNSAGPQHSNQLRFIPLHSRSHLRHIGEYAKKKMKNKWLHISFRYHDLCVCPNYNRHISVSTSIKFHCSHSFQAGHERRCLFRFARIPFFFAAPLSMSPWHSATFTCKTIRI